MRVEKRLEELRNQKMVVINSMVTTRNGQPFILAAAAYDESGKEISSYQKRCDIRADLHERFIEEILPMVDTVPEDFETYPELLKSFMEYIYPLYTDEGFKILNLGTHFVGGVLFRDARSHYIFKNAVAEADEIFDLSLLIGPSVREFWESEGVPCRVTKDPLDEARLIYETFRYMIQKES